MSSKRKNEDVPTLSGRDKKKQKTALARTIAVQTAAASGMPGSSAEAGPSKGVRFNDGANLPGSLDVERFAEARAFEMNAMHSAMQNARTSGTQRAWQQLPRHLRRRAASHDVRRVPARLREKAREEMDTSKAKKKSIPKRGKGKRPSRTKVLLRRQEQKVWLETHIWHAKRMHMEELWGYRLAATPTEKSHRPSHRASMHGSILHDASYMGLIELRGPDFVLKATFDSCCDAQTPSPAAKRYQGGSRTCDTHLYERGAYPLGLIAPITVLWQTGEDTSTSESSKSTQKASGNSKGKERANVLLKSERTVWVWVHPSVFDRVFVELRTAASFALEAAKEAGQPSDPTYEIQITDLREQLNVFEIMGPKSSQVIKGALKPVVEDDREEFKKCWGSLDSLQTTASVPRSTVIGFKVYDPRLSFPPKNAKVRVDEEKLPSISTAASAFFPSAVLARSEIWNEDVRRPLRRPMFQKKDIDKRRAEHLVPGKPLQALAQDARIPALLIQRSVESSSATRAPSIHGWTLIVPQGWGMAFFSSLIFTGTRVGGQRERETQAFESGTPYFPRDYPSTLPYDDYSDTRAEKERELWERKPPAKRHNYERLGNRSPWQPDWEVVLGLREPEAEDVSMEDDSTIPGDFVPAQRDTVADGIAAAAAAPQEIEQSTVCPERETGTSPWMLRGPSTGAILESLIGKPNPASLLFTKLEELRGKRGLKSLYTETRPDDLWKSALVDVRLRLVGRGRPDDLAVIYGMDDEETTKWHRAEQMRKKPVLDEGTEGETELSVLAPSPGSIIGYVTTGNFSLSTGEGLAIGAIPVSRYIELQAQARRLGPGLSPLIKVRDRHEAICRAARVELVD
ncbi:hypothetical protein PHLGIDRAFT_267125 [Phlebiopsis gigantea 11061_1 CR5-6]|uniref:POP1-domain-containing protein n=1 Tax=Phlebiopsis gigantea (strain 11061_1 CR5-6) TaxID=745531 RepID=A0A0C3SBR3_PHLG1|nr:hypothetical protein PHLGIDRAFT_267125 [Phlebiopsis gigantea 11061_1 CR5-6]